MPLANTSTKYKINIASVSVICLMVVPSIMLYHLKEVRKEEMKEYEKRIYVKPCLSFDVFRTSINHDARHFDEKWGGVGPPPFPLSMPPKPWPPSLYTRKLFFVISLFVILIASFVALRIYLHKLVISPNVDIDIVHPTYPNSGGLPIPSADNLNYKYIVSTSIEHTHDKLEFDNIDNDKLYIDNLTSDKLYTEHTENEQIL